MTFAKTPARLKDAMPEILEDADANLTPRMRNLISLLWSEWKDLEQQIAAMNPGVKLPDHAIIPIHRSDGSGDTFIFTQYLSFSDTGWKNSLSYGTTVSWPAVSGAPAERRRPERGRPAY